MPFDTIIGHERPKRFLQAALRSQRLAHALLFHGEEQIGKRLTARVLAQAVNCEDIPPPAILIDTIAARLEVLLPTIRSRCQEIRFAPLAQNQVETAVRRQQRLSEHDTHFLAIISGGRLGLALEADPEALRAERAEFLRLVSPESVESVGALLAACEAVAKSDQAEAAFGWLATWFRDLVLVKIVADRARLVNADCQAELEALASRLPVETMVDLAAYVESMTRGLERNLNKQLLLEGLLLRLKAALQPQAA